MHLSIIYSDIGREQLIIFFGIPLILIVIDRSQLENCLIVSLSEIILLNQTFLDIKVYFWDHVRLANGEKILILHELFVLIFIFPNHIYIVIGVCNSELNPLISEVFKHFFSILTPCTLAAQTRFQLHFEIDKSVWKIASLKLLFEALRAKHFILSPLIFLRDILV